MAKEIKMHNNQAELKQVAKAIGASLKRSGHPVPHTQLLNALASALNKRNWNTLVGASQVGEQPQEKGHEVKLALPDYSDGLWALLKLAHLQDKALLPSHLPSEEARENALQRLRGAVSGVLEFKGWVVMATLDLRTSSLDVGDFLGAAPGDISSLEFQHGGHKFRAEVGYSAKQGWFLTHSGLLQLSKQLDGLLTREAVVAQAAASKPQVLPGAPVVAQFWTDDHVVEVDFDIRTYLLQAKVADIADIISCGYSRDTATDFVAEWCAGTGGNTELVDGFHYLSVVNKSPRVDVGFNCRIDGQVMLEWMHAHCETSLAQALCSVYGVTLVPENGNWKWIGEDLSSEDLFDSSEAAASAAMKELNLFKRELASC